MKDGSRGVSQIIAATVVAGIAGYAVTWLVYRQVGPAGYALFAVFWAALYLVVGGLSGIQQEITRATHPLVVGARQQPSRSRNFGVFAAVATAGTVIATAPLWVSTVFQPAGWGLVWPLAVGAGSYVLVATMGGSLYGISHWRSLAIMIVFDGVTRLVLLAIGLLFTHDVVVLAWMVALPFPLTIAVLLPVFRRGFVGRSAIDVGYRRLSWNVARTILASVSTAVLVSGFPLLLGVTAQGQEPALVGELIFTITLTRAPLIITLMSLQSYLVVRFRDHEGHRWMTFLRIQGLIVSVAVVLALLGWGFGPAGFGWISGAPVSLDGPFIAILVGSSALVATLSVAASAVLARSKHFVYSLGWVVAAVVTVAVMFSPIDFLPRVALAVTVGPIAGILVYCGWWTVGLASRMGASISLGVVALGSARRGTHGANLMRRR